MGSDFLVTDAEEQGTKQLSSLRERSLPLEMGDEDMMMMMQFDSSRLPCSRVTFVTSEFIIKR